MLALILNIQPYKESDQFVTILNSLGIKLTCKAKSVKKITSRNLSKIEVGNILDINLIEGKQFKIITESKLINNFAILKNSKYANYLWLILETLQKLPELSEENEMIFNLSIQSLNELSKLEPTDKIILAKQICIVFVLKIFIILGVHINFENYVDTNSAILVNEKKFLQNDFGFSNRIGESSITDETYKILKFIYNSEFNTCLKLKVNSTFEIDTCLNCIIVWLENLLNKKVNSYRFLLEQNSK